MSQQLPTSNQRTNARVQKSRDAVHAALGRTEQHRAQSVERLEAIIASADAKRIDLQKRLPDLARAAETATGEERDSAHRAYLSATDLIRCCDQVHNAAKHELITARNL